MSTIRERLAPLVLLALVISGLAFQLSCMHPALWYAALPSAAARLVHTIDSALLPNRPFLLLFTWCAVVVCFTAWLTVIRPVPRAGVLLFVIWLELTARTFAPPLAFAGCMQTPLPWIGGLWQTVLGVILFPVGLITAVLTLWMLRWSVSASIARWLCHRYVVFTLYPNIQSAAIFLLAGALLLPLALTGAAWAVRERGLAHEPAGNLLTSAGLYDLRTGDARDMPESVSSVDLTSPLLVWSSDAQLVGMWAQEGGRLQVWHRSNQRSSWRRGYALEQALITRSAIPGSIRTDADNRCWIMSATAAAPGTALTWDRSTNAINTVEHVRSWVASGLPGDMRAWHTRARRLCRVDCYTGEVTPGAPMPFDDDRIAYAPNGSRVFGVSRYGWASRLLGDASLTVCRPDGQRLGAMTLRLTTNAINSLLALDERFVVMDATDGPTQHVWWLVDTVTGQMRQIRRDIEADISGFARVTF